jgi:hypothetical protein
MVREAKTYPPAQLEVLRWTVRFGAVTAEALAHREGWTVPWARARMRTAERAGLVSRRRPLSEAPALYTATPRGLRACGLSGFGPCRVSVANAPHAIACSRAAAALERGYPDHRVTGERELRREEHECGSALASASLGRGAGGTAVLHRPDLVLWPERSPDSLPIAVEVELTVKAPSRLLEICRAWARCRCVAGVLYLTSAEVQRPLARAIDRVGASDRIVPVSLDALAPPEAAAGASAASTVPIDAYVHGGGSTI